MDFTNTPCGRCIALAEKDLGPLTDNQKADLLLDNFSQIKSFAEALDIVRLVTVSGASLSNSDADFRDRD